MSLKTMFNNKGCVKMATAGTDKAIGIKFHRQHGTADVSKVSQIFVLESGNFLEECCGMERGKKESALRQF